MVCWDSETEARDLAWMCTGSGSKEGDSLSPDAKRMSLGLDLALSEG